MPNSRLQQQLDFLKEIDKLKNILRQTILMDGSRRENDAEHSWHLAMMAMVLLEYADDQRVSLSRVLQMALIHDLVEIDAGDTFAYDEKGYESKEQREKQAADRIFGLLPEDQGSYYRALWEEFDAMQTPDSLYAGAIDRLQPLMHNIHTDGYTWRNGKVNSEQVYRRMQPIRLGLPRVWPMIDEWIQQAIEKGQILP